MSFLNIAQKNTLKHSLELTLILAEKEIKTRYKKNIFGYLWSVSNPLAYTLIFYFAFEVVLKTSENNFILFLISGLFVWQWISNYTTGSTLVFIQNTQLIKKANFPRFLIPLTTCLQDGFHFLVSLPIIVLFMVYYNVDFKPEIFLAIPLNFLATFIFLIGMGLTLASLTVLYYDIQFLTGILIQMVFYMTPILYSPDRIPPEYLKFMYLNFFFPFIMIWRNSFMLCELDTFHLSLSFLYAFVSLSIGIFTYKRVVWKFSEIL